MSGMPQTTSALSRALANSMLGNGEHLGNLMQSGMDGTLLGEREYDPALHSPFDVDQFSLMGAVTGDPYVKTARRAKPLNVSILVDDTSRQELAVVTDTKRDVRDRLEGAVKAALPGMTDKVKRYEVVDLSSEASKARGRRRLEAGHFVAPLGRALRQGMTFMISDFAHFTEEMDLTGLVAVKVDHPMSRRIPANIGRFSLGGYAEVNTNDPNQLAVVNKSLAAHHQGIVDGLIERGAAVAQVVTDYAEPHGYDLATADSNLAIAIRTIAK